MFTKLFNNDESPEKSKAPAPPPLSTPAPDKAPWAEQLRAAAGNDEALLSVAKSAPFIDIKHAAVQALMSEDALKRAEREFRNHDRRVHREAKQRWEAKVAEREARAQAAQLLETATALVQESNIPANRLVEQPPPGWSQIRREDWRWCKRGRFAPTLSRSTFRKTEPSSSAPHYLQVASGLRQVFQPPTMRSY